MWQAKNAAEQARDAAVRASDRIFTLDAIGELSSAITVLQEIMRLQRTQAWDVLWDVVLDRYEILILHLARSHEGVGLTETHRTSVRAAIGQFRMMARDIEGARTGEQRSEINTARLNRSISEQAVVLEQIKIAMKKAGT